MPYMISSMHAPVVPLYLQRKRPSAFIIFLCCLRPDAKIHFCKLQDRVGEGGGGGFLMHVHFIPFCLGHYVVERPTSKSPTGLKPVTTARQCMFWRSTVIVNIIHRDVFYCDLVTVTKKLNSVSGSFNLG